MQKDRIVSSIASIRASLKPRFCWWRGNVWDIFSLVKILALVCLFLPILPWETRKEGNYSIYENVHQMAKAANRGMLDADGITARYRNSIQDEKLKKCIIARNIVLTMVADTAVMDADMRSLSPSNVPIIFIFDSLIKSFIDIIAKPNFSNVIQDVAKKCEPFPGEYLSVDDVSELKSKDLPRGSFWELF
jgi:hypothetical protein